MIKLRRKNMQGPFLIPIAKAFQQILDAEVADLGIQVHGGMGYVEETGAAQVLRDVRVRFMGDQRHSGYRLLEENYLIVEKLPMV